LPFQLVVAAARDQDYNQDNPNAAVIVAEAAK